MTKVFEYKAGSLVDKVGKQVGQAFDIINKRSEIGQAIETKGEDTSYINFPTFDRTDLRSWSCWIKFNEVEQAVKLVFIMSGSNMAFGTSSLDPYIRLVSDTSDKKKSSYPFKPHIWYQLVCNYDETGVPSLYINTIESIYDGTGNFSATNDSLYIGKRNTGNAKSVQIAKLCFYTHELTEEERLADYKEFLQSQPTEKPIRGFELVKPTDLSYQKDRGLLAAYNMKPNGSTLVDISGNSRHGTLNGGLINTKDGLGFNGVNGYIGSLASPTYTDKLSVSVRFKPNDDTYVGYKGVIGDWNHTGDKRSWFIIKEKDAGNKYEFDISTTGLWVSGRSIATDSALIKNQWYTLTAVYNGAKIYMYLNGVKQTAESNVTGNLFQGDLLQIGLYTSDLQRCFNGEIGDVRIYNRELTEQEIKDYHNSFIKPVILEDWSGSAVGDLI